MRITRLEIFTFPVPFKVVFRHASASRRTAENLIVAVHSDCGKIGYGEGCPRHYVTGETPESGLTFLAEHRQALIEAIQDESDLMAWIATHQEVIDRNPAAFCAVEIAILDLIGKVKNRPVEDLLAAPRLEGVYRYTAVLGDSPYPAFWWQLRRYWRQGFRDYKVKISGDFRRDRTKIRLFAKRSDPALRLRLDANNLWTSAEECVGHMQGLSHDIFALEEPLGIGDLEGCQRVGQRCGTKIVLDESFLRLDQLDRLEGAERWIINLRVSKMGGIHRTLELARQASQRGIALIVGAQVGETSILTRAALTVINAVGSDLVACEGAFGTHLLRQDLTVPCLMFGSKGLLDPNGSGCRDGAGLGLAVRDQGLAPLS